MAVTATPAFAQVPNLGVAVLTTAKTTPNSGSSNVVLMFTPGANGSMVTGIVAIPRATISSAAVIVVYTSIDSGTTCNPVSVGALAVWTFSATAAPTPLNMVHPNGAVVSPSNPLYLPSGTKLYASTGLTADISVTADGIDL